MGHIGMRKLYLAVQMNLVIFSHGWLPRLPPNHLSGANPAPFDDRIIRISGAFTSAHH
jgi:hypothetical protein